MSIKSLLSIIAILALAAGVLCFAGCGGDAEAPSDPSTTAAAEQIFVNTARRLAFGLVSCYTNPQGEENADNPENLYGIMDSDRRVIVEPKYAEAFPVSPDNYAIVTVKDGETYSSMINADGKAVVPSFKGEIKAVCHDDTADIAIIEPQGGRAYIVDMSGKKLLDRDFGSIYTAERQDMLQAFDDAKAYYISLDGKMIAELPANKPVLDPFGTGKGGTVLACVYDKPESGNPSILYGLYDSASGREIVPCTRKGGYAISENRFVLKDTNDMGPDYDTFAAIYDKDGKVICADGEYQDIIFDSGNTSGVGVTLKQPQGSETSELKYYVIDVDGKKLSQALDQMPGAAELK